MLQDSNGVCS